jgi:hypothetical protein
MTVIALLAVLALVAAAVSLVRLSRVRVALAPDPEERTFASLRVGDVVVTPRGDWLVEERGALDDQARTPLFTLRAGREQRFLFVPQSGALGLLAERPASLPEALQAAAAPEARLERPTVDLLPGGPA